MEQNGPLNTPFERALEWAAWHVGGVLGMTGFTVLLLLGLSSRSPSLSALTEGGQFAAYSLAFVLTSFFLIHRSRSKQLRWSSRIGLLGLLVGLASLAVAVMAFLKSAGVDIDDWIIPWPSVATFAFSALVAFLAVLKDEESPRGQIMTASDLLTPPAEGYEALRKRVQEKREGAEDA